MDKGIKIARMKSDLKRGLSQVFLKKGLTYVVFTDIYISSDYRYARVEIDTINHCLKDAVEDLNSNPLHKGIIKDLHNYVRISNFPKIVFAEDSHKKRIEATEELFNKMQNKYGS